MKLPVNLSDPTQRFKWILGILAGIAVLVGIILALSFQNIKPPVYVGQIFGKNVTLERYEATYRHIHINALLRYGKMLAQLASFLDLDQQTWDQLVLLQEARRRNIKVGNAEVIDHITRYDVFQRNDKFDPTIYRAVIRAGLQSDVQSFEESIRSSLLTSKLFDQVTAPIQLSNDEILKEFKHRHDQIQLTWLHLPIADYKKDLTAAGPEIQNHFEQYKEDFRIPDSINVEYIKLDFPPDGGVQKEVENKFKARAIVDEYARNPDFKALGEKFRFPAKETGFFHKEKPNFDPGWGYDVLLEAFKMNVNEIHEPIEIPKVGYLAFRIKEKKDSRLPDLAEAQDAVKEAVIHDKAKESARTKAEELLGSIRQQWEATAEADRNFSRIVEGLGLKTEQTPFSKREEVLFNFTVKNKPDEKFYDLTAAGQLSEPLLMGDGFYLFHVDKFEAATNQQFADQKEEFSRKFIGEKKDEAFDTFMSDLTKQAAVKKYFRPKLSLTPQPTPAPEEP